MMVVIGLVGVAAAQTGTLSRRTATFSNSSTATLQFSVPSLLVDRNQLPSTTLVLEFGQDGSASVGDPGLGDGVGFTLTLGALSPLSFPITNLPSGNTTFPGKLVSMTRPAARNTPGLFVLSVVHTASTESSENWELGVTGVPANVTPAIRGIAGLFGSQSGFSRVQPIGACTPFSRNGTLARRTVTAFGSRFVSMQFTVPPVLVDEANQPAPTTLVLEYGVDGSSSVVDPPSLGNGVGFRLRLGSQFLDWSIATLPSRNTHIPGKRVSMTRPDPEKTPGLLVLSIVHTATTQSSERWELGAEVRPKPPNLPMRSIATLFGSQSGFFSLLPIGNCGGAIVR